MKGWARLSLVKSPPPINTCAATRSRHGYFGLFDDVRSRRILRGGGKFLKASRKASLPDDKFSPIRVNVTDGAIIK